MMVLLVFSVAVVLAACSDENEDQTVEYDVSTESQQNRVEDGGVSMGTEEAEMNDSAQDDAESSESNEMPENTEAGQQDRKIIYTADMRIEVRDYQESLHSLQSSISEYGGYLVESSMYEETENSLTSGFITARIPQEHFDAFIEIVEDGSDRVVDSAVSGQDVTEEYIDLE